MWKHIFGYANTRFCLCQDTGTMNQPLRLTDCSQPISWVYVGISRIVRHAFTVRIWYIGVVCKAKTSKGTMRNALFSQHLRG